MPALARPADRGLPFSVWSLSKLPDFLVAEGAVDDISHEGLRSLLREEWVSFPSRQDLEDQHRPRLRGQEEPGCLSCMRSPTGAPLPPRRPDRDHLHGRVRAAEPPTPSRQAVGTGRGRQGLPGPAETTPAGDLTLHTRGVGS